jgi:hypothetical protein
VSHSRNVEMTFALAIQILLAQIGMAALENRGEKSQLIFFAQGGHGRGISRLDKVEEGSISANS